MTNNNIIETMENILEDFCCNRPTVTIKKEMDNILILSVCDGIDTVEAWVNKDKPDLSDDHMHRIALRLCGIKC